MKRTLSSSTRLGEITVAPTELWRNPLFRLAWMVDRMDLKVERDLGVGWIRRSG